MDCYTKQRMRERTHVVIGLMSAEKLGVIAHFAGLDETSRVIDFGCGYGETLLSWAKNFGISGIGIDISETHIEYAKNAIQGSPFANKIDYVCTDATTYPFEPQSFDLAACITASNMFGEADVMFGNAIKYMKAAIKADGYLLLVEPYYTRPNIPQELIDFEGNLPLEIDLLHTIQREGFELVYMMHADRADWDRYISSNLYYNTQWLREHRNHPEWQQKFQWNRCWQEMYVRYRSQYQQCVALLITRL